MLITFFVIQKLDFSLDLFPRVHGVKEAHGVEESDGVGAAGLLLALRLLGVRQEVELLNIVPKTDSMYCITEKELHNFVSIICIPLFL